MITPIGVAFILTATLLLVWKKHYGYVLVAALFAPAGLALIAGSDGLPVFYLAAFGAALIYLIRRLYKGNKTALAAAPGRRPLIWFLIWSLLVTLISPLLFSGINILSPKGMQEYGYLDPDELNYTFSNIAQSAYLILGISVVMFMGSTRRLPSHILGLGLGIMTILSFGQIAFYNFGLTWPDAFFVNISGGIIDGITEDGDIRFRGVHTEPSALAIASLTSLAFFLTLYPQLSTFRQKSLAIVMVGITIVNLTFSASSTALLGAVSLAFIMILFGVWHFAFKNTRVKPLNFMLIASALVPIAFYLPLLLSTVRGEIENKVLGTSYATRTGGNLMSFDVLADTWFLGAGLGSHKPFALWATLIANTGLIGTLLFLLTVSIIARTAWKFVDIRPTVWALIAVLTAKMYAGSALSEPLIWISLGVIANRIWTSELADSSVTPNGMTLDSQGVRRQLSA